MIDLFPLYLEIEPDVFVVWNGTARTNDGTLWPPAAVRKWTAEEKAAVGLYQPKVPPVSPNQRIVSKTVQRIDGIVQYVYELAAKIGPRKVSAAQAKLALDDAGLLDAVEEVVNNHQVRAVQIWYKDANEWDIGHVYVQALAAEMGLTDDVVEHLFAAASLK